MYIKVSSFSVFINIGLNSHAYFDITTPYDLFNWAAARELHSVNCDDKIIVRRVAHSALNILNSEVFLIRNTILESCLFGYSHYAHIRNVHIMADIEKVPN